MFVFILQHIKTLLFKLPNRNRTATPKHIFNPIWYQTDQEPEKFFLFLVYFEHHKVKVKPGDKETKKQKHYLPQLVWGITCTITTASAFVSPEDTCFVFTCVPTTSQFRFLNAYYVTLYTMKHGWLWELEMQPRKTGF